MTSAERTALKNTGKALLGASLPLAGLLVLFAASPVLGWLLVITFWVVAVILGVYAMALHNAHAAERREENERLIEQMKARQTQWEER